jgi:hypothetical protein
VPGVPAPLTPKPPSPAAPSVILVTCPSCNRQMTLGAHLAGKAVKCPGCQQVVKVPAGTAAPPPAPRPPAAPATIAVTCPSCARPLNLGAHLAGKSIKCPGCQQVLKVPGTAAPPPVVDEEVAPVGGGRAIQAPDDPFADTDVPENYQEEIRQELGRNEKILWVGRSSEKLVRAKSWIAVPIGGLFILVGIGLAVFGFAFLGGGVGIGVGCGGIFFALVGTLALFAPKFMTWSLPRRAAYVVTTRHCIIYDPAHSLGAQNTVYKFNAIQLQDMKKEGSWFLKGGGSLVMDKEIEIVSHGTQAGPRGFGGRRGFGGGMGAGSRSTTREIKIGFIDVADVNDVEKVVREALLDRMADKMVE